MELNMDMDIFKARLKEALGDESQTDVGNKLHMTQGNVSKLLSGMQQPTLDTIYNIAKVYDVSVDWLLGISENKKRIETDSYASIILMLMSLNQHEAATIEEDQNGRIIIRLEDPLIRTLIKKGLALYGADRELYQSWIETKLSVFADKRLLYGNECIEGNVYFRLLTTSTESEWLEVYKAAKMN